MNNDQTWWRSIHSNKHTCMLTKSKLALWWIHEPSLIVVPPPHMSEYPTISCHTFLIKLSNATLDSVNTLKSKNVLSVSQVSRNLLSIHKFTCGSHVWWNSILIVCVWRTWSRGTHFLEVDATTILKWYFLIPLKKLDLATRTKRCPSWSMHMHAYDQSPSLRVNAY
jgi:hypothetical protein